MIEEPILWFDALSKASTPVAGGKGANLGEMTKAGLPVPPGFVVTASAFLGSLDAAGIRRRLVELSRTRAVTARTFGSSSTTKIVAGGKTRGPRPLGSAAALGTEPPTGRWMRNVVPCPSSE